MRKVLVALGLWLSAAWSTTAWAEDEELPADLSTPQLPGREPVAESAGELHSERPDAKPAEERPPEEPPANESAEQERAGGSQQVEGPAFSRAGGEESTKASPTTEAAPTSDTTISAIPSEAASLRRGFQWDLELSGGFVLASEKLGDTSRFSGRLRAGLLMVREPMALSVGAIAEVGGLPNYGVGVALEAVHFWNGLWLQPSYLFGDDGLHYLQGGVGWSLFGIEGTRATSGDRWSVQVRLRAPLGIIYFLATS